MEDDDWVSDEEVCFKGLLSDEQFSSVASMVDHHLEQFGIDFRIFLSQEEESNIMMVNFVRSVARNGLDSDSLQSLVSGLERGSYLSEEFMRPVLQVFART